MATIDQTDYILAEQFNDNEITEIILGVYIRSEVNVQPYVRWTFFFTELEKICLKKGLSFNDQRVPDGEFPEDGHMTLLINNKTIENYLPFFKIPILRMYERCILEMIKESNDRKDPKKYLVYLKKLKADNDRFPTDYSLRKR